jgi:WD40 repeat protein
MLNAIDDLWDASMRSIPVHSDVLYIAFSHKEDLIAVGELGCVEVFETLTGRHQARFTSDETAECWALAFSPDSTLLATGCIRKKLKYLISNNFRTLSLRLLIMPNCDNFPHRYC